MPSLPKNKKKLKGKTLILKILGVVFLVAVVVAGVFLVQNPQFFASDAKIIEGNCSAKKKCPSGFKCNSGNCVQQKGISKTPKPDGARSTPLGLRSCTGTGNCGVKVNSSTKGAFQCTNRYDRKTYWCCPSGQGEKN